jgi:hypothetical protein
MDWSREVMSCCAYGLQGDVFSRDKPRKSDVLPLFSATLQKLQGDVRSEPAVGCRVLGVGFSILIRENRHLSPHPNKLSLKLTPQS